MKNLTHKNTHSLPPDCSTNLWSTVSRGNFDVSLYTSKQWCKQQWQKSQVLLLVPSPSLNHLMVTNTMSATIKLPQFAVIYCVWQAAGIICGCSSCMTCKVMSHSGFCCSAKNSPCTSSLQQICVEALKAATKRKWKHTAEGARGNGLCCQSEVCAVGKLSLKHCLPFPKIKSVFR